MSAQEFDDFEYGNGGEISVIAVNQNLIASGVSESPPEENDILRHLNTDNRQLIEELEGKRSTPTITDIAHVQSTDDRQPQWGKADVTKSVANELSTNASHESKQFQISQVAQHEAGDGGVAGKTKELLEAKKEKFKQIEKAAKAQDEFSVKENE
jgi:hypothetical protein